MESRIKSFVTLRRFNKSSPEVNSGTGRPRDIRSTSYNDTIAGNPPVLGASPVRGDKAVKIQSTKNGLTFTTSPYEDTSAGKPPTMGTKPLRGNGPVKLQTSRRLSSGELLQTNQDSSRTFMDLKNGDYVVGRKEKRESLPRPRPLQSHSTWDGSPSQSTSDIERVQSPILGSGVGKPSKGSKSPRSPDFPVSDLLLRGRPGRLSDPENQYVLYRPESAPSVEEEQIWPRRPSLQSQDDPGLDQNTTIKALWKAEYTRLVALYGKEGVDRNIAEMNRSLGLGSANSSEYPHGLVSHVQRDRAVSVDSNHSGSVILQSLHQRSPAQMFNTADKLDDSGIGLHTFSPPFRDTDSPTTGSLRSFSTLPSRISSEDSSSFQAGRTSFQNGSATCTKEDVRRIVEDMRSNYLKAIESSSSQNLPRKQTRASFSPASETIIDQDLTMQKTTRQSWHGATTTTGAPPTKAQVRKTKKRAPSHAPTSDGAVNLARADSTTLGAAFPKSPKQPQPSMPTPPLPLSTPNYEPEPAAEPEPDSVKTPTPDVRPMTNGTISTISTAPSSISNDLVSPVIDNYDIFYLPETLSSQPPQLPEIDIASWSGDGDYGLGFDESAPPPPSISWTPRKKSSSDLTVMT